MLDIFFVTIPFFALMACGYAASRLGLFGEAGVGGINAFVFYFALPALLFRGMADSPFARIADPLFIAAYGVPTLAVIGLGAVAARMLFRAGSGPMALLGLAGGYSNIGFLGLPLIVALLGPWAAAPLGLVLAFDLIVSVPLAMAIMAASGKRTETFGHAATAAIRAAMINPLILSMAAGIAVAAFEVSLPGPVDSFTRIMGSAAGPAALFAMGAALVGRPVSEGKAEVALVALCKLALHPLAVWAGMALLYGGDGEWGNVAVLAAGLPVAGMIFVLGQRYDIYPARASTAVLASTVLAMISFPILLLLMR
ncbi:MAG: AEC family transporter [Rhodospirillales bacterium]|nr:AEC family transporter [Rhodospirillales bacterium]MCW8862610.1 AEC family transporter [Rhodospirillales bacterium]MCW8951780.1 AEC family transporter [Rhodospirillales bacterium]MCW8970484.1 AEC family transporter [Rhodospirillales bacterium]MCW9002176.1 AEC family transporter [Rhodospirillales bacterium]